MLCSVSLCIMSFRFQFGKGFLELSSSFFDVGTIVAGTVALPVPLVSRDGRRTESL